MSNSNENIKNTVQRWSDHEKALMHSFICLKRDTLKEHMIANINGETRRNKSLFFKEMSSYIGTKKASQCKSRYQKIEKTVLHSIDLPQELLKAYFIRKGKKRCSFDTATTIDKIHQERAVDPQDRPTHEEVVPKSIDSWQDLHSELKTKILPFIKDKHILSQMQVFTASLLTLQTTDPQTHNTEIPNPSETHLQLFEHSISSEAQEDTLFFSN